MKRTVIGLALLSLSIGCCVLGSSVTSPAQAVAAASDYGQDPSLNYVAARAAEAIERKLDDVPGFSGVMITTAGVEVDGQSKTGIDYLAQAKDALASIKLGPIDAPLLPQVLSVPVTYKDARYSFQQLLDAADVVSRDHQSWLNAGVDIAVWGPHKASNRLLIRLRSYSPEAARELEARYGDIVDVDAVSVNPSSSSRTDDYSPFWGGVPLQPVGCTSGFKTLSSFGNPYSITSGHCHGSALTTGGAAFGTVTQGHYGDSMDAEIIKMAPRDLADNIWSDPTSYSRDIFAGSTADVTGHLLCTDGNTDKEVCRVQLVDDHVRVTYTDGTTLTNLVYAQQLDNRGAFRGGDSGGPVIEAKGSDQARAVGIISGKTTDAGVDGYYQAIRYVESYFNITLDCGATSCY